jgi:8-oxo-dGTP pyrophosphatase MutT (NUDIX family)
MYKERSAGIIIVRVERKLPLFLLLRRKDGKWDFCQGRTRPFESRLQAALRELKEETGIPREAVVLDPEFRHTIYYISHKTKAPKAKAVCYFLGTTSMAEVKLNLAEHSEFRWADMHEALSMLAKNRLKFALLLTAMAWLSVRNLNRHVIAHTRGELDQWGHSSIHPSSILKQAHKALKFIESRIALSECFAVDAFWGPLLRPHYFSETGQQ